MKQLDFLLLGIDQLVNTYNIIRNTWKEKPPASFTIMPIIVDSGYEGPQSNFNNLASICAVAHIPGYTITNKRDADQIIRHKLITPGFRIIGVSQRLFKTDLIDPGAPIHAEKDATVFQYTKGRDATIVSFNLSFPEAWKLYHLLKERGTDAEVFSVNSTSPSSWSRIIQSAKKTKKIIVLDDTKADHTSADVLMSSLADISLKKKIFLKRKLGSDWLHPIADEMKIDYKRIAESLKS